MDGETWAWESVSSMPPSCSLRYPASMPEIALGLLVVGVLLVADADRLQSTLDRVRDLIAWLAE